MVVVTSTEMSFHSWINLIRFDLENSYSQERSKKESIVFFGIMCTYESYKIKPETFVKKDNRVSFDFI